MDSLALYSLLLMSAALCTVRSQGAPEAGNVCTQQSTCGECISANDKCGWCMQLSYPSRSRCDTLQNLVSSGCDSQYLVMPDHDIDYIRDLAPRDAINTSVEAIQLSPQRVNIKLRPNKQFNFEVTFKQAENYPVDLYYVMDMSYSMNDDKDNLAKLGKDIAIEMQKLTKNFRLGFGSFVDKKTMPYVSIVPSKLVTPCTGCTAPYGFKNQLPLSENPDEFTQRVTDAPISGNLDSPEGTFDAMMQAITCGHQIGWRDTSRKMLLVSTDNDFHYAGDGKLGGIVTPNDGACHLNSDEEYSMSLEQDYPSVSQLAYEISEKKVNVIFAITSDQLPKYNRLSSLMDGSVVGMLADDSRNIVQLVKENYQKISSKVELRADAPEGVDVRFKTKCRGSDWLDVAQCEELKVGENVTFSVTINVNECPTDPAELEKNITIYPVGLTEKLEVSLSLICSCPCEDPSFPGIGDVMAPESNSSNCNASGTFECGACTCNPGHYGKICECDGSTTSTLDYEADCRRTNDSKICEGHGTCECGQCVCNPLHVFDPTRTFSGKFCECNDYGCDFFEGELCGGPTRGVCKCGTCQCLLDYEGPSCNCPKSTASCMAANGLICNGKGVCNCGKCECTLDQTFKGPTCEDCPSCPGQCDANKDCVQCVAFGTGKYKDDEEYCRANCTHVVKVPEVEKEKMPDRRVCKFRDEDDCDFYFTYFYNSDEVRAQTEKVCPEPVNVLAIVLGVIGGIIAIGLALLLIWKLLVTIHDRREFAKFEKERRNAKWDMGENPIFKPSTSTFQNPTYGNK